MLKKLKGLFIEEEGQGMAEYGLIIGFVAVAVIAALIVFRDKIIDLFKGIDFTDSSSTTGA